MIHVFLGLITGVEDGTVGRVPVVRRRIAEILLRSGVRADSHTGRRLLAALRTLPRDELLEAPTGDLLRLAQLVVDRAEKGTVGVFARIHLNRDFVSVLVYFPADRFGPEVRRRVRGVIAGQWPGEVIGRDDRIVELGLARMQFLIAVRPGTQPASPDRPVVEAAVAKAIRRWRDDLRDLLVERYGEDEAENLLTIYQDALPEAYKEDFDAASAVDDLAVLHPLPHADGLAFALYTPAADDDADRRLKVFRTGRPVSLARALPIFTQMGIEVLDERPYEIDITGRDEVWIYDFGLRLPPDCDFDEERSSNVIDALELLWRGEIEQDGFNALVVRADLTWWQANVLRAYAKYLRQAGTAFSQGYIEQALVEHADIACAIVDLFEARFDPARTSSDLEVTDPAVEAIEAQLAEVSSLDQDSILRSMLALVMASLRTNAYRTDDKGRRRSALAIKLDPHRVPGLPEPRPRYEVWVYSPRVEGVHLRFGPVARGGLRWSDRREDFRTEILGLVKAQMVKNAVIVPTGAKGGFVAKLLPDPAVDREAWLAEGIACYRTFISSLLDLTDNYVTDSDGVQSIVAPPQVRRYDADDAYLVVAADKGTATFSDIANGIAERLRVLARRRVRQRRFGRLRPQGDGHHRARRVGVGEVPLPRTRHRHAEPGLHRRRHRRHVRRRVRQRHAAVRTHPVGRRVRPPAHLPRPDPDAASSFAERRRMFELPRSSWADYDQSLISEGGGVYARTLKSMPISAQVRAALGLADDVTKLTPTALIHAILVAPVDLLWNGGIGTYVKASTEPQQAAGDKANDALRADGNQLRARVVGEGGNLGLTQLGRVEYARAGGRINTDAIDNSAGVDTSDHEVNLKILLDRAVASGEITREERNELLQSVTDDVAAHVLRDNYGQNVLLGMARKLSPALVSVHQRVIQLLEEAGELDRAIEFLPSDKEIEQREVEGVGLFSPENAVLVAYVKIALMRSIEASTVPDEPWFQRVLAGYFPPAIAERFASSLGSHPLHREIITTVVVNDMINRSGTTFVHRAMEETGAEVAQIARAYAVVREVFGLQKLWAASRSSTTSSRPRRSTPATRRSAAWSTAPRRWFVDVRFPIGDVAAEIERFGPTLTELSPRITEPRARRGAGRHRIRVAAAHRTRAAGRSRRAPGRTAQHLPAARRRRDRERQPALGQRDRRAALRAVRSVLRRRDADRRHPAAARRPVVDAGARGDAARRVRGAVGDHRRGAAHHR